MSDLISRKSVLNKLKEMVTLYSLADESIALLKGVVNMIKEEHSAGTPKKSEDDWTPSCERLPEKEGRYLTTVDWSNEQIQMEVFDLWYADRIWLIDEEDEEFEGEVIAWKPLPTPYKEGSEEDEIK